MSKYFFISDIHACFDAMVDSLKSAGFKKSNNKHILVVAGDVFQKGADYINVFNYLTSIPKDRLILVRGDYEYRYLELLSEITFPTDRYDYFVETINMFCDIANIDIDDVNPISAVAKSYKLNLGKTKYLIIKEANSKWAELISIVKNHPITEWLTSDEWVNYFEIDNNICVHSFIPVAVNEVSSEYKYNYHTYELHPKHLRCIDNWRDASPEDWRDAALSCNYRLFASNLFNLEIEKNKDIKLICGHWKVNEFHNYFNDEELNFNIYFSDNLIALDSCAPATGFCNVLVYDQENGCYFDRFKNKLPLITIEESEEDTTKEIKEEGELIEQ